MTEINMICLVFKPFHSFAAYDFLYFVRKFGVSVRILKVF